MRRESSEGIKATGLIAPIWKAQEQDQIIQLSRDSQDWVLREEKDMILEQIRSDPEIKGW